MNCFSKKNKLLKCSICLDDNSLRKRKLNCGHKFHFNCIEQWLKNNKRCPLCNKEALPFKEQLDKDLAHLPSKYRILTNVFSS